jgi:hypothetical protein
MRRASCLVAAALLFCAAQAAAAPAGVTGGVTCKPWPKSKELFCTFDLKISGPIDDGVAAAVDAKIKEWHKDSRDVHDPMVTIDSVGGSVVAAMAIGQLLRQDRLPIVVERDAICASSCVLILAGAVRRIVFGRVAIHRPFLEEIPPKVTAEDIRKAYPKMLALVRAYFQEMNISDSFADDMYAVKPEGARYLSRAELERYGLGEIDTVESEVFDLEAARKLGIKRMEFMRRKLRKERVCSGLQGREHIDCSRTVMNGEPYRPSRIPLRRDGQQ